VALDFTVRLAQPADALNMAKVIVDTWRETYRGVMSDAVLDDPGLLAWRETFWAAALTDPQYAHNIAAVAVYDGTVIGVAMSGPPLDGDGGPQQLYILYTYAAFHGSGAGAALLDLVIDPTLPAVLWVADSNSRAQAFYRKHGFVPDGAVQVEHEVREIRMVRAPDKAGAR
jgi:ribosomal protein S18 acetylase RimI-like enzyme